MNQRADSWKNNLGPIVTKPPKDHQVGFRVTLTGPTTDPPGSVFLPRVQALEFDLNSYSASSDRRLTET